MMEWENKLYQILLKEQEAEAVVDDWVEGAAKTLKDDNMEDYLNDGMGE